MTFAEIEEETRFRLVIRGGSLDALGRRGMTRNYLDPVVYIKVHPYLDHRGFNVNAEAVNYRYGCGYIEGWREISYEHHLPARSQIPYY